MAKYVPDVKTQRWVVISPQRSVRPSDKEEKRSVEIVLKEGLNYKADCPFCAGNEIMTPPEITRIKNGNKNWLIRVVSNKYPITDIHEVVIHSPDHYLDIPQMQTSQVEALFHVYQERYKALSKEGDVLIFNNKGLLSGESLNHPHSQIVVIPKQIKIDVLPLEPIRNIVHENDIFIAYCPDFSQWPYEVWIAGKEGKRGEEGNFSELSELEIGHLASLLQKILRTLLKKFPDLSYNFYISPYAPFYLRIIPRLLTRAGFELGTGLSVNFVDPEFAAEELKRI